MKIAIGCDNAGVPLLNVVREVLKERGIEVLDYGVTEDDDTLYPDVAYKVATTVADGEAERGVLICGTGIGMCITANKVSGIRAAHVHDTYSAERAQLSNNAQIITMGARVIASELGRRILETWLDAEFKDGRSTPKVARMNEIDEQTRSSRK